MTPRAACSVLGCGSDAESKGLCWLHYGRFRRNGDPTKTGQHGGHTVAEPSRPPDPAPVRTLRAQLERSRAMDASFGFAWSSAIALTLDTLREPLRSEWSEALTSTRRAWFDAYFRLPVSEDAFPLRRNVLDDDARPGQVREAPAVVSHGTRHDGESTLEPQAVAWCS